MNARRVHPKSFLGSLPAPLLVPLLALAACAPAGHDGAGAAPGTGTAAAAGAGRLLVGTWRAVLASPGGELPFTLEIADSGGELSAVAISGGERAPFSAVSITGDDVLLAFDWYDSRIEARLEGETRLAGRWEKTVPGGVSGLDFVATKGDDRRFLAVAGQLAVAGEVPAAAPADVSGVWQAVFTDEDGSEPATGEFRQEGSRVVGTFLTPLGDYRFLEGSYEGGLLRLSTFDGGHAFLFHARAREDGALSGDFWSRDRYHATWTATRADGAAPLLPDAWELAGLTNDDGRFRFAFPDLEGRLVTSEDPRFAGKVVVANVFGSWCPNCNDEAPLLAGWHRRYGARGLELVGLAYEFSGDPERDRIYVGKYANRHGIDYPLLLAGVSDKEAAGATLPDLTAVVAFPTTVFIGRDGRVRRIHSGFAGPGTGEHHAALVAELESLLEQLLAEPV
ncbi:MAG: TlpA family protein disulfide reductase [Acidobacteriota bacterium]|nr:TlpA family protein disulfide reductase [Acidobacteriota bacterium]